MSHFTDDDAIKALRAHSRLIEANLTTSSNKNYLDQWFASQQPITAIERDDTETWTELGRRQELSKHDWKKCGLTDAAAAAAKMPRFAQGLQRLRQRHKHEYEMRVAAAAKDKADKAARVAAKSAAVEAEKKIRDPFYQEYEKDFEQNMWEMESGMSCWCNTYPWQHELHPSGTVVRRGKRQREDEDIKDPKVKRQKTRRSEMVTEEWLD